MRVKPGARRTAIVGVHGGALKVAVNAPPEKGKANDALLALLADALGLPAHGVSLVSGAASPNKVVVVELAAEAVRARLGGEG